MQHLLTFDVEDWFHLLDNRDHRARPEEWARRKPRVTLMTGLILDFLEARKIKATFYVVGWIAEQYPELLRRIAEAGHEIGCHSHLHQLVWGMSPAEFRKDLRAALNAIETAAGTRPTIYRAPGFSVTRKAAWSLKIMSDEGIRQDSSILPGWHSHGGMPSAPGAPFRIHLGNGSLMEEFPVSTLSVAGFRFPFSGAGYFRLLPLKLLMHQFRAHEIRNEPLNLYFHPRDFDPGVPRTGNLLRDFKSRVNSGDTFRKLAAVSERFELAPLRQVRHTIPWNQQPVLELPALA